MEPRTVAVTGATGFIGLHLLPALVNTGYRVKALSRRVPPADIGVPPESITWVIGSLSQEDALRSLVQGADAVVHCAGAIKALNRESFFEINGTGTKEILDATIAQSPASRFVYLSSLAARAPHLSSYAASKRQGEDVIGAHSGALDTAILRPPAVYGPGDMETLRIFRMAARGFVPVPSIPGARMSLVHVGDVVGAILAALNLESLPDDPIEFDDGHRGGYTWFEIISAAGAALKTSPRLVPIPRSFLYLAGAVGSLSAWLSRRPRVLSWGKVPELLHPDWVASSSTLPGYNPLWDIEKGFEDAVRWYTSQGLLIK